MKKTILFIATMDTKAKEIGYAVSVAQKNGCNTLVLDCSTRYPKVEGADVTPEEILSYSHMSWEEFAQMDKGERIDSMALALVAYVKKLYEEGKFDGVMSIGGGQNSRMASSAMKECPYGVPKLVVSTLASGKRTFDQYIGNMDIMVMHSVIDIAGLNSIARMIINNAVAAMIGAVNYSITMPERGNTKHAAITMLGVTTRGANRVIEDAKSDGMDIVAFHANGVGGVCMEKMEATGYFDVIIDMNLHELTCEKFGGFCEGAYGRLKQATQSGIPQIIVPGAVDILDFACTMETREQLKEETKSRQRYFHNATILHTKVTKEEIVEVSDVIAERLNDGLGPITVLLPLKGFCEAGAPGGVLYNPDTDMAFIERLKSKLNDRVKVVEIDANINDEVFADAVYEEAQKIMKK